MLADMAMCKKLQCDYLSISGSGFFEVRMYACPLITQMVLSMLL